MEPVELSHPTSDLVKTYENRKRTLLLNKGSADAKRQELHDYFHQTFSLYETLFLTLLNDNAFYLTADPLRHPLIFYYGHTAVFFINKLVAMKMLQQRINPQFESLFAIGVDEMSWDSLNDMHVDWPSVQSVKLYRDQVRAIVSNIIATMPINMPITWNDPAWIILMGIEHERIHLETSSVLIRQLPLQSVRMTKDWLPCNIYSAAPDNALLPVKGTHLTLGKNLDDIYGWDNEYGHLEVNVNDFYASKYLVSNQEFLSFIQDDGYHERRYWTEEGWQWRQFIKAELPRFWIKRNDQYFLRIMNEEISMPWNWPAEVNYLESKAFCNWLAKKKNKNIRLPTEAEWYVLARHIKEVYPQWQEPIGNIDLGFYASPCPINFFKHGDFYDVIGNVWQWSDTIINGYPGFKTHPAYDDFSIPTFEGKHNLIKGGSWISTGNVAAIQSRYAFRRHFYQHAGFRYVESDQTPDVVVQAYETDKVLSEYLEFHFGDSYFNVPNFPKAIADAALIHMNQHHNHKALDLGCAVGRTSFELSKYFDEVYAIDLSTTFINAANQLQNKLHLRYTIPIEGDILDYRECSLDQYNVTVNETKKIKFLQGDACNLKSHFNQFNLIVAANIIDRLYDPIIFLEKIHERLVINGVLLISSPYTWLEEYTDKEHWLGGIKLNGENMTSLSRMTSILEKHFILLEAPRDIPFVIRETQRKFQHSISQITIWKRIV